MKKKICFINCSSTGSTGNLINDLACYISEEYEVCYILGDKPPNFNKSNTLLLSYTPFLYKLSRVQTFLFGNDGFLWSSSKRKIKSFLNQQKPDIIHIHNVHRSFFNLDGLIDYCKKNQTKIVWTLHDEWLITGRCCCTQKCLEWKNGCKKCEFKNHYPRCVFDNAHHFFRKKRHLLESIYNQLYIVTPSNWLNSRLIESGIKANYLTINNGIDTKIFDISSKNIFLSNCARGRFVIGGAALYLTNEKGFDDFSKLSKMLSAEEYLIALVGAKLREPKFISDNLLLLPRTSSKEEMASFYNSIDIFVNPTKSDNYPTTHLESIACGTPVITYDVGGASEVILEGINGFSVKYGSIERIIESINIVKTNKDMLDRKKVRSSKDVSSTLCVESYKNLYKHILS